MKRLSPVQVAQQQINIVRSETFVMDPLLTVSISVYNHQKYLKEAVDSILRQETRFPIEIIISDDCSTDESAQLLMEYQRLHPDRIMLCLADQNLWDWDGWVGLTPWYAARMARGRYVMFMDGDDYFTSMHYLQNAVDFLEGNPGYGAHFCNAVCRADAGGGVDGKLLVKNENKDRDFSFEELSKHFQPPTAGLIMRLPGQSFFDYEWCTRSKVRLIGWCLAVLADSSARFSANVASVYRVHDQGMATTEMHAGRHVDDLIAEFGMLYGMLDEQFGFRKHDALMNGLRSNVRRLIESHLRHSSPRILDQSPSKELIRALWGKLARRF